MHQCFRECESLVFHGVLGKVGSVFGIQGLGNYCELFKSLCYLRGMYRPNRFNELPYKIIADSGVNQFALQAYQPLDLRPDIKECPHADCDTNERNQKTSPREKSFYAHAQQPNKDAAI